MKHMLFITLALLIWGCSDPEPAYKLSKGPAAEIEVDVPPEQQLEQQTEVGPVRATVRLVPKEPRFGDRIQLTLEVRAEKGVEVLMPLEGEALGRFNIVDYREGQDVEPGGADVYSQSYTLDAPMSGSFPIPSLLVEFIDRREAGAKGEIQELLTDEIPLEIGSVMDDATDDTLRPARGPLDPLPVRTLADDARWWMWALLALALVLAGGAGLLVYRRAREARNRKTAFDVAWAGLLSLESSGMPEGDEADRWYVRLSGIVRRYLEDHFGLRAPELTTEEFLAEARASDVLDEAHRGLLEQLLERSDRVKFAGYRPGLDESTEALEAARRFLSETRSRTPEGEEAAAA